MHSGKQNGNPGREIGVIGEWNCSETKLPLNLKCEKDLLKWAHNKEAMTPKPKQCWICACDPGLQHHITLQWRHNGRDSVSNHQPRECLLNRLIRRRSKKTSKIRVTGLCAGNCASYAVCQLRGKCFHLMTSSWQVRMASVSSWLADDPVSSKFFKKEGGSKPRMSS